MESDEELLLDHKNYNNNRRCCLMFTACISFIGCLLAIFGALFFLSNLKANKEDTPDFTKSVIGVVCLAIGRC